MAKGDVHAWEETGEVRQAGSGEEWLFQRAPVRKEVVNGPSSGTHPILRPLSESDLRARYGCTAAERELVEAAMENATSARPSEHTVDRYWSAYRAVRAEREAKRPKWKIVAQRAGLRVECSDIWDTIFPNSLDGRARAEARRDALNAGGE